MNDVLKIFLSMSLSGSLLIIILFAGKHFLKDRVSRQWQYYIWLIVIARLLLPFAPETNLMGTLFKTIDHTIAQSDTVQPSKQNQSDFVNIPDTPPVDGEQGNVKQTETPPVYQPVNDMIALLVHNIWLVWLTVALILLIQKVTVYKGFVRYVEAGQIPISDTELLDRLAVIGEQSGVKKPVELCVNPLMSSPLLIGFFNPCIVLPGTDISEKDFRYIVQHELTHYRRRDMFYKWLVQVTVCLHWFNPLVYLMSREINKACEFSCDEVIISKSDSNGAQEYGKVLLKAMANTGLYKESLASVTLSENKEELKERLSAIMHFKKKTKLSVIISICLTCVLGVLSANMGVYAANISEDQNDNKLVLSEQENLTNNRINATDYVIECVSEELIIKQGGEDFKIELDSASRDNYIIRDNRYIPMGERHYRYNKWDIIIERKKGLDSSAVFASTITLTIPDNIEEQFLYLVTKSGNIRIEELNNVNLIIESDSGDILIDKTNSTDISAKSNSGNVQLTHMLSTGNIEARSDFGSVSIQFDDSNNLYSVDVQTGSNANISINGKRYNGGGYTIGDGGRQTLTLIGYENTFSVSNIHLYNSNITGCSDKGSTQSNDVYWTENEFILFMQEQKQKYTELLEDKDITQEEFDTYISTDEDTLKEIQNGIKIPVSSTGNVENGIGN